MIDTIPVLSWVGKHPSWRAVLPGGLVLVIQHTHSGRYELWARDAWLGWYTSRRRAEKGAREWIGDSE